VPGTRVPIFRLIEEGYRVKRGEDEQQEDAEESGQDPKPKLEPYSVSIRWVFLIFGFWMYFWILKLTLFFEPIMCFFRVPI